MYRRKFKPTKAQAKEFAEKMTEIDAFCEEHNIQTTLHGDSYYFTLNDTNYRVSNHTVEASNRHAYNDLGEQVRDLYHPEGRREGVVYITAGKTRIIEIYKDLEAGYELDKRGFRKNA